MKRLVLFGLIIVVFGGAVFTYYQYGGSPEVRRERHLKKGQNYLKLSKLNEAIVEFRNAVKADPRSAESRLELAMVLIKKGDLRAAYGELRRAVDLKPDLINARYELALMELLGKTTTRAKEHLEKLREQDRNGSKTRYLAAKIALAENAPDKAIIELKELLKRDPQNAIIYVDLGRIQFSIKDLKSAEESFRKALEIDPKIVNARVALAQLYVAAGDQAKGEEELILATRSDPENEALLHVLGIFYSVTRKSDHFEQLYLNLLKNKPNSMIGKKRLAEFYLSKGRINEARQFTDEILKAQPGDVDGHFFRGRINLAQNNPQKAVEDFTVVTKGAPRLGAGYYFLALAQRALNQTEDAKKSLVKAVDLSPNWIPPRHVLAELYALTGNADLALEQTDKILPFQPKNEAMLIAAGAARLKKGEVDKALAHFIKAKEANPNSFAARMNIAAMHSLQKKIPLAIKEYEEVLKLDPERVEALNSIVRLQLSQGNFKAAFDHAEQHLSKSKTKNQAKIYELMGLAKLSGKEYSKGVEYLNRAIEINPNLISAYFMIGNAYAAQLKFDTAIEQYEKASAKNSKAIPPLVMIGMIYDRKNQPKKANEYYRKVLDIDKNIVLAANNLAYNYVRDGGNLDVALGIAQKAREANPDAPSLADTLGWIYYKKGAYSSAIGLLRESNEKFQGTNPEVLYHLGMAYAKTGETKLATETLVKALSSDQAFFGREEAKKTLEELKLK
jgi:tetratricopeptide (TPR) repeat protein